MQWQTPRKRWTYSRLSPARVVEVRSVTGKMRSPLCFHPWLQIHPQNQKSLQRSPSRFPEKSKCYKQQRCERLHGRGWSFVGGGVVQLKQDQVALTRASHRLGQRCNQTRCTRSADKNRVYLKTRGRGAADRWPFAGAWHNFTHGGSAAHRRNAVTVRLSVHAGGSPRKCIPNKSWGEWLNVILIEFIPVKFCQTLNATRSQTLAVNVVVLFIFKPSFMNLGSYFYSICSNLSSV